MWSSVDMEVVWFVHNKYTVLCCDSIYIHFTVHSCRLPTDKIRGAGAGHYHPITSDRVCTREDRDHVLASSPIMLDTVYLVYTFSRYKSISMNPQRRSSLAMLMRLLFRLQLIIKAPVALSQSSSNSSSSSLASSHRDPISISLRWSLVAELEWYYL